MKKIELRSLIGEHNTHYLKWNISDDLSIRYFYMFNDKRAMEGKFFIKSHKNKEYSEISKEIAYIMIKDLKLQKQEIIGKQFRNKFIKLNIDDLLKNEYNKMLNKINKKECTINEFSEWCSRNLKVRDLMDPNRDIAYIIDDNALKLLNNIGFKYPDNLFSICAQYTVKFLWNNSL